MNADEVYDEVFEFWIPGVCLSGKIHGNCDLEKKYYIILSYCYFRNFSLGIYWKHPVCCYSITVRINEL